MKLNVVRVSAVVLVDERNRILVATRPSGRPMAGFWEFPGGKLEQHETPRDALVRELAEELSIDLHAQHLDHLTVVEHAYPDFFLVMDVFITRFLGQQQLRANEGQKIAWVTVAGLREIEMPPADAPIIDAIAGWVDAQP